MAHYEKPDAMTARVIKPLIIALTNASSPSSIAGKAATAWHGPSCMGNAAELLQRYREGQEDPLGALGLVVNAIVLWNTLYMFRASTLHLAERPLPKPRFRAVGSTLPGKASVMRISLPYFPSQ